MTNLSNDTSTMDSDETPVSLPILPAAAFPKATIDAFYQQEDITDLQLGDIIEDHTVELSPLFSAQAALLPSHHSWLPVLRLVSVMIRSPRAIRFLHTIFYGTLRQGVNSETTLVDTVNGPLSVEQERAVDFAIQELSKVLTSDVGDFDDGAETNPIASRRSEHFPGTGSEIIYGRKMLQEFSDLWRNYLDGASGLEDIPNVLISIFRVTSTVVHELAHAAWMLRADGPHEPFMDEFGSHSELGFAFEAVMFGGIVTHVRGQPRLHYFRTHDGIKSYPNTDLYCVLHVWPMARVVQKYVRENYWISSRGDLSGFLDATTRIWLSDLARRCTRAYWDARNVGVITQANKTTPTVDGPQVVRLVASFDKVNAACKVHTLKQIAGGFPTFAKGTFSLKQVDTQQANIELVRTAMDPDDARDWVETVEAPQAATKPIPASVSTSRMSSRPRPTITRNTHIRANQRTRHPSAAAIQNSPAAIIQLLMARRQDLSGKSFAPKPRLAMKGKDKHKPKVVIDLTIDFTELQDVLQKTLQVPVFIAPGLLPDEDSDEDMLDPVARSRPANVDSDVEITGYRVLAAGATERSQTHDAIALLDGVERVRIDG